MDFWDKLTKKASETYKGASEKTNKIARETKLKIKINDNKSKIEDLYEEIGKKIYQKHVANEEINIKDDIKEDCKRIDDLANEIEVFQKEIWGLKDSKQCPNCKSKIGKDDAFCPNCGAKQEEEQVVEAEVIEESNNQDTTEEVQEETESDDESIKEENDEN